MLLSGVVNYVLIAQIVIQFVSINMSTPRSKQDLDSYRRTPSEQILLLSQILDVEGARGRVSWPWNVITGRSTVYRLICNMETMKFNDCHHWVNIVTRSRSEKVGMWHNLRLLCAWAGACEADGSSKQDYRTQSFD